MQNRWELNTITDTVSSKVECRSEVLTKTIEKKKIMIFFYYIFM